MCFSVLYRAKERQYQALQEEIGQKEGEYIRLYKPPLNRQIPKEDNWRKFTINQTAEKFSLCDMEYKKKGDK